MVRYVRPEKFEELTGYSVKAIERLIKRGDWKEDQLWIGDRDDPQIDLHAYDLWVRGEPLPELPEYSPRRNKPALGTHHRRRRGAVKRQTPAWANRRAIEAIYFEARRLTAETGVRHEVDHTIPLLGRLVSGLHVETNLQIIPAADNAKKCNKFEL